MKFRAIGGSGPNNHGPGAIRGVSVRWDKIGEVHDISDPKEIEICLNNTMLTNEGSAAEGQWKASGMPKDAESIYKLQLTYEGFNPETASMATLRTYAGKNHIPYKGASKQKLIAIIKDFIVEKANAKLNDKA